LTCNHASEVGEFYSAHLVGKRESIAAVWKASDLTESLFDPSFSELMSFSSNASSAWLAEFVDIVFELFGNFLVWFHIREWR
jgi:hypothetical protein